MASLEREFLYNASKQQINNCNDIEALKLIAISMLDLVERQKKFMDVTFKKFYLGIDDDGSEDRDRNGGP